MLRGAMAMAAPNVRSTFQAGKGKKPPLVVLVHVLESFSGTWDGERSDSCDDDEHRSRTPSHVPENDSRPWTRTTSGGFLPLPAWNVERTLGAAMAIAPRSIVRRAHSYTATSDSGNGR